jgi:hypothetical protein
LASMEVRSCVDGTTVFATDASARDPDPVRAEPCEDVVTFVGGSYTVRLGVDANVRTVSDAGDISLGRSPYVAEHVPGGRAC